MPVQIPELKRMDAPTPASVGRSTQPVLNTERDMAADSQAGEQLGSTVADFAQHVQNAQDYAVMQTAVYKFEKWYQAKMDGDPNAPDGSADRIGIRQREDDPGPIYRQFDKDKEDYIKQLSTQDVSPRLQTMIDRHIRTRDAMLSMRELNVYGHQQQKYDNAGTYALTQLRIQALTGTTESMQADADGNVNLSTTMPFQQGISAIRNPIIESGKGSFQVKPYSDGDVIPKGYQVQEYLPDGASTSQKIVVSPVIQHSLAENVSKGIVGAIKNLYDTGTPDSIAKAKYLQDNYGDMIDAPSKIQLDTKAGNAVFGAKVDALVNDAQRTGSQANILKEKDADTRAAALKMYTEMNREQESNIKIAQTRNANAAMNLVLKNEQDGHPFPGSAVMEKDGQMKPLLDGMAAKDKQKLADSVDYRKHSTEEAITNLHMIMIGQDPSHDISKMSPAEYRFAVVSGLNAQDQKQAMAFYDKAHSPTGANVLQNYRVAGAELSTQLEKAGIISKDQFGHYVGRSGVKFSDAVTQMRDYIDSSDHPMKPDEARLHAKEVAAHIITGEALKPMVQTPKFNGATNTPPAAQDSAAIDAVSKMSSASRVQAVLNWRKANNSKETPSSSDLWKFLQGNK